MLRTFWQPLRPLYYRALSTPPSSLWKRHWWDQRIFDLLPATYVARTRARYFTDPRSGFLRSLIKRELTRRYYAAGEAEQRRLNREQFWGTRAADAWHAKRSDLAPGNSEFERWRVPVADAIAALPSYTRVCEIGAGNGIFLDYLSRRLPETVSLIGIDLSATQVKATRSVFPYLQFEHAEITDWIARQSDLSHTLFVANSTVEFFTEAELLGFLRLIKERGAAIVILDTINIDLERQFPSVPRGIGAWSHNYPHLIERAGLTMAGFELIPVDGTPLYNGVLLTAVSR